MSRVDYNESMKFAPLVLAAIAAACGVSAGLCFLLGVGLSLLPHAEARATAEKSSKPLLQFSVVLLGATASVSTVVSLGWRSVALTAVVLVLCLALAWLLARRFGLPSEVALLIGLGTAICGASAIAAAASARKSTQRDMATALGVVLLLNAIALYLYPWIGTQLALAPREFGLWSALAIHDTSSVVGAALRYAEASVAPATTLKLLRALWIVPVTALLGVQSGTRARPWFILGFFGVVGLATLLGETHPVCMTIAWIGRRMLGGVLLLVGWSLPLATVRTTGWRPLAFGAVLAGTVGIVALGLVKLVY